MDDLLTEFLTETSESLAVIDVELVRFEQDPNDAGILGNIFRLVHTIKGTCGFLGLPRLEAVAHAGENILGKFRDGVLEVTPEAVTLILRCIDTIRDLLAELEENSEEPDGNDQDLIDVLNAMAEGNAPAPAAAAPEETPAPAAEADIDGGGPAVNEFGAPVAAELLAEVEMAGGGSPPPTNEFGAPVALDLLEEVADAQAEGFVAATDNEIAAEAKEEVKEEVEVVKEEVKAAPPVPQKSAPPPAPAAEEHKKESAVAASSIRVHVDVLEDLMTLVSELVLTRNQLLQMVRGHDDSEFTVPLQRLSHITSDLQEGVMKTRMQPIGNAWAKLPRIVRDLAVESGKKIELVMVGAETELDRQVLELIKDPLTHMVRNSADHGLEDPAGRSAAGKTVTGQIILKAYHEGGHIIIQIRDDGRGLSMERIRTKIIDNNLATESELDGMTENQIQQYIFKAGFSTAEKVTNISGRGVGMDVVRTNIERIGGTCELKSTEGTGTVLTIKIPLTLAIVSALIVECGGERFAIPQISVLELVRASDNTEHAIEMINNSPVLRLRNRLLPLISLSSLLKLGEGMSDGMFIVVTQVGTQTFGIIVDKVFDTEEIVVKPVAPVQRNISAYSGNTILGDGSVIMILDPNGIASHAGEVSDEQASVDATTTTAADQTTSLLVFRAGGTELKAVPLALIARLEEVDLSAVETVHGTHVVNYREHIMPLIPFDPSFQFESEGRQPVLVFTDRDRSMGLVVDEIVDIVDEKLVIELVSDTVGVVGTATIAKKATDIIDSSYYLTKAFPDWFGSSDTGTASVQDRRALLVDDSQFFRNLLTPLLSVAGWEVRAVESAEEALKLRENGQEFDVIISDIEMPGMNGFEFAESVRSGGAWSTTPMVALSVSASEADFVKGRDAGFDDYVAKHDRDALVTTLAQTISMAAQNAEKAD
ncbi:MAG: response regulator [Rhodospirillales bacterium]|nr:response regulator [Rhodospirillales bacterium]